MSARGASSDSHPGGRWKKLFGKPFNGSKSAGGSEAASVASSTSGEPAPLRTYTPRYAERDAMTNVAVNQRSDIIAAVHEQLQASKARQSVSDAEEYKRRTVMATTGMSDSFGFGNFGGQWVRNIDRSGAGMHNRKVAQAHYRLSAPLPKFLGSTGRGMYAIPEDEEERWAREGSLASAPAGVGHQGDEIAPVQPPEPLKEGAALRERAVSYHAGMAARNPPKRSLVRVPNEYTYRPDREPARLSVRRSQALSQAVAAEHANGASSSQALASPHELAAQSRGPQYFSHQTTPDLRRKTAAAAEEPFIGPRRPPGVVQSPRLLGQPTPTSSEVGSVAQAAQPVTQVDRQWAAPAGGPVVTPQPPKQSPASSGVTDVSRHTSIASIATTNTPVTELSAAADGSADAGGSTKADERGDDGRNNEDDGADKPDDVANEQPDDGDEDREALAGFEDIEYTRAWLQSI